MNNYDIPIQRLELIIEHWFDKEELYKHLKDPTCGLCFNLFYALPSHTPDACIIDYLDNCKEDVNEDNIHYPVEGSKALYFYSSLNKMNYLDPRRLHLAVYMLSWLRQHNI